MYSREDRKGYGWVAILVSVWHWLLQIYDAGGPMGRLWLVAIYWLLRCCRQMSSQDCCSVCPGVCISHCYPWQICNLNAPFISQRHGVFSICIFSWWGNLILLSVAYVSIPSKGDEGSSTQGVAEGVTCIHRPESYLLLLTWTGINQKFPVWGTSHWSLCITVMYPLALVGLQGLGSVVWQLPSLYW